jgi:hypothetical protein
MSNISRTALFNCNYTCGSLNPGATALEKKSHTITTETSITSHIHLKTRNVQHNVCAMNQLLKQSFKESYKKLVPQ